MAETLTRPQLYELRWISGRKEGACWIRGVSEDDVIAELQANASWYGVPHEHPLIVWAIRTDRVVRRLRVRPQR